MIVWLVVLCLLSTKFIEIVPLSNNSLQLDNLNVIWRLYSLPIDFYQVI